MPGLLLLTLADPCPTPADLARRLSHADPFVRRDAAGELWLLAEGAEPARRALVRALRDHDADVRQWAALAPPDPAALPWLRSWRGLPHGLTLLEIAGPAAGKLAAARLTGLWPDWCGVLPLALSQYHTRRFELHLDAGNVAKALARYGRAGSPISPR